MEFFKWKWKSSSEENANSTLSKLDKKIELQQHKLDKFIALREKIVQNSNYLTTQLALEKDFYGPKIDKKDITILKRLGNGKYGVVHKAVVQGHEVAVKQLISSLVSKKELERFAGEIKIMSKVHHKNICMFLGACLTEEEPLLVTELCEGSLDELLKHYQDVPKFKRLDIAKQICEGMAWLHRSNICHCDLKPANVLLGKDGYFKITDFGFAQILSSEALGCQIKLTPGGSARYMAPERLNNGSIVELSTDVYSFAILTWEIIMGKAPYYDHHDKTELLQSLLQNVRPPLDDIDPELESLLTRSWHQEPSKRPPMSVVMEELSTITILAAISDRDGREFWVSKFSEKFSKNETQKNIVPTQVPWEPFLSALNEVFRPHNGLDLEFIYNSSTSHRGTISRTPLSSELERASSDSFLNYSQLHPDSPDVIHETLRRKVYSAIVKLEKLLTLHSTKVDILKFGVLCDTVSLMTDYKFEKFLALTNQPWFFGFLHKDEAFELLAIQDPDTFLVRISTTSNRLVLSRIISIDKTLNRKKVIHTIIEKNSFNQFYLTRNSNTYSSVDELVKKELESGKLKQVCPPFQPGGSQEPENVIKTDIYMSNDNLTSSNVTLTLPQLWQTLDSSHSKGSIDEVLIQLNEKKEEILEELVIFPFDQTKTATLGRIEKYRKLLTTHLHHDQSLEANCPFCQLKNGTKSEYDLY